MSNIKKAILLRVRIAFLIMLGVAFLIIFRLINIQFVHGDEWREKAAKRNIQLRPVDATRGNVYSDNGSLLATSIPKYQLAFDPYVYYAYCKKKKKIADYQRQLDSLCDYLHQTFKDRSANAYFRKIEKSRQAGSRYIRLGNRLLKYHEKKQIETWPIFREGRMKGGVIFEKSDVRTKPFGFLAERTIGYVKEETNGKRQRRYGPGLEYSFDSVLAGVDGRALFEKYSGGGWKPVHNSDEIEPIHGYDISTTINVNLQDVAEEALLKKLLETHAENGCVLVMEVATGEVKAIANLTRRYRSDSSVFYQERYNFAVGKNADPGSTFKIASLMAVLEENESLSLKDSIDTENGVWRLYDHTIRDDHYHKNWLTVQEIIEMSSNVGMAKLVDKTFSENKYSQSRFIDYLNQFGLKRTLDFQIKGAAKPMVKTPEMESWSGITLQQMAIGYEIEMSPLQILTFYNAIANKGKMITPIIVNRVGQADQVIQTIKPRVLRDSICSKVTLQKIQTALEGVVQRGTAKNILNRNYQIAGKTGTAQKIKNGKYVKEYYASFAGYFPAKAPKYSMIVVIDNPAKNGKYGAQVAAPVFKEIADKIYARDIDLHPVFERKSVHQGVYPVVQAGYYSDLKYLLDSIGVSNLRKSTYPDWVKARINSKEQAVDWTENQVLEKLTPDVTGMRLRDAIFLLENAGLKVKFEGEGRVIKQSHLPRKKVLTGSTINLILG